MDNQTKEKEQKSLLKDLLCLTLALFFAPPGGFLVTLGMVIHSRIMNNGTKMVPQKIHTLP